VVRFNLYDLGNVRIDEASLSTRVNSNGTASTYQILDFNGDDFGEAYGTVWNNAVNGSTFSSGLDYDTDNYYDGEDLLDALQEAVDGDGYIYFALICEDESTNNTQGEVALGGIELNIETTQRINYTITNSFGGGQIIVNGDYYNSGAVIPWIPGEDIVLESYDQTYQGDSYFSLNKWTNLTDIQVIDQNPWTTFFLYDVEIRAEYIKEIQITVATSFGSESIDVDGENHPSGSVFNWFTGEEHTFFATQSFIIDGQYYSFTGWSDCSGNAYSSNPLTLSFDDNCSLTAEYSITHAEKEVANHYNGNNIENSTLSVPGLQESIPSGSTVVLEIDHDYSIVTDAQIIIEPDVKHHDWLQFSDEFRLNFSFNLADRDLDKIVANFKEYSTAMLVPAHDDISYQIRDPWYVNSEGLQSNAFHDIAEVTQNNIYPSVFLEQGYENGIWTPPYYSVNVEEPVTIGTISGEKWAMEFNNWSESSGKATFQDADALETPVVFHADGAEIRANYDPYTRHLASETDPLIRNNGDRVMVYGKETHPLDIPVDSGHLVYDGNRFFMVYQEDNQLFLTSSANCETWTVDELLPQSVHSYLGTEVEVEIVDYSIAFANGSIDSDFNRSAFSIAWVERVTAGGGFTGYAAYYVEKDIATNSWSNLIELENSFLVGSAEILNGIELLTDIKGDSENYASFVAVLEKELDGSFYFDAIRSIAGQGQFETVFENKPGRQVSITSEGMGSSLSYLYIAYLDDDELTHQGYNIVNGRFDQKRVISSLFPNSYDHQNPSIIYVSEGDHNDPRYSYIAWEATRGGYSEIVTAKVNSQGSGSVESGHVVSARYQRKNCTSPVLSYNQVSHEFALTYESAGEVIQIANLDTFSPR
jgi:hypothetical protein